MGRGQPTSRNGGATPESSIIIFLEQRVAELEKEINIFRSDPQFQVCVSQEKYIMRLEATIKRVKVVRKELATQVLNGHAVKMLDKALAARKEGE